MLLTFSSLWSRHLPIWKTIWFPLATAGVERAKVSASLPNQPLLSTAALQEFTSPVLCHRHHTAAAHGILPSRLEQGWGRELPKPAVMALHKESSACPPQLSLHCPERQQFAGAGVGVLLPGRRGSGGRHWGCGAVAARGVLTWGGNRGTCSWELLPATNRALMNLLSFSAFLYRQNSPVLHRQEGR